MIWLLLKSYVNWINDTSTYQTYEYHAGKQQPSCGDVIVHHPNLLQELTVSNTLGQLCQGVVGSCQLPQTCEPRRRYGEDLREKNTEKWWFNQGKSWTMLVLWCLMHGISSNFISVCWRYVSNFISVCVFVCLRCFKIKAARPVDLLVEIITTTVLYI